MISSDVIRGYTDTMVLYLLWHEDSYGYRISKDIRLLSDDRYSLKETTLYSTFSRLERNGYITAYSGDETHGKQRTYYRITKEGRVYYTEKCREWALVQAVVKNFIMEEK